jgi:tRNA threonylcarbamoyladenosine biosynthesis protein TsaB
MKLLALETATEACSVALYNDGQVIVRFQHAPRLQTALLLPMLDEVMAEAGVQLTQIDALAYSRGPGAFTGVRIAAAAVQALAFARDIPVVPVSSLHTLAQGVYRLHKAARVLSIFDARMDEVYAGAFEFDKGLMQPITAEVLCHPTALPEPLKGQFFLAGNGAAVYEEIFRAQCGIDGLDGTLFPSAEDIIPLAVAAYEKGAAQSAELALPVYLRDEVWKKLPGR